MKLKANEIRTIIGLIQESKGKIDQREVLDIFMEIIIKNIDNADYIKLKEIFVEFLSSLYIASSKNKKEILKRSKIINDVLSFNKNIEKIIKRLSKELHLSPEWIENKLGELVEETGEDFHTCVKMMLEELN